VICPPAGFFLLGRCTTARSVKNSPGYAVSRVARPAPRQRPLQRSPQRNKTGISLPPGPTDTAPLGCRPLPEHPGAPPTPDRGLENPPGYRLSSDLHSSRQPLRLTGYPREFCFIRTSRAARSRFPALCFPRSPPAHLCGASSPSWLVPLPPGSFLSLLARSSLVGPGSAARRWLADGRSSVCSVLRPLARAGPSTGPRARSLRGRRCHSRSARLPIQFCQEMVRPAALLLFPEFLVRVMNHISNVPLGRRSPAQGVQERNPGYARQESSS